MDNIFFVDFRISDEEMSALEKSGANALRCPKCPSLYDAVSGHPDMLLNITGKKRLVVNKDMDVKFLEVLKFHGYEIIPSKFGISAEYPADIILNALNLNSLFVHNLKYTDPNLKSEASGKKFIHVKQGYTKCSCAVVSEKALMTSDMSVFKALLNTDIDVLLLKPGGIVLPGLDYGFIGGTCGLIDSEHLAFYGNLDFYPQGKEVLEFLKKHNVKPVYLSHGELIDRGSILGFTL